MPQKKQRAIGHSNLLSINFYIAMLKKLQKSFVASLFTKTSFVFIVFFSFGFLLLPQCASAIDLNPASWLEKIFGLITYIPSLLFTVSFEVMVLLTGSLAAIAGEILNWVLSEGFSSVSYTNPAENPVISAGFNIVRDLTNMALVLILVFIAFSTILRISGHQTQKLLISLIAIALLINFAPVFCGLIVDASNIVMHFFTDRLTGMDNLMNIVKGSGDRIVDQFTSLDITEQISVLMESSALIIFNCLLTFILLMFSFLFMARYVVIWILVILSPIAFISYILPATKKIWNNWWEQLIQWSIIGAIAGFFLYLGQVISLQIHDIIGAGGIGGESAGLFDAILPHMITIFFLIIGVIMSFQTSAMGASQIIAVSKKAGRTASKWSGRQILRGEKALEKKFPETKFGKKIGEWAERHPTAMKAGKYAVVPWRAAEAIPGAGKYAKRARKKTEETKERLYVHIEKRLESGNSQVATIEYKHSTNEKEGKYLFIFVAPY